MDEVISSIAVNEIPTASAPHDMSGVRLRSKIPQIEVLKKLKKFAAGGCPINKKTPTRMSRESFIASCKILRAIADKDKHSKNKYVVSTLQGFRPNNRQVCLACKRGEAIEAGESFDPPLHITFIELTDLGGRPMFKDQPPPKEKIKKKPKTKGKKLTKKDVARIRKMHKEGYSVPGLCELFPVTASTMYRVINGESWRGVK